MESQIKSVKTITMNPDEYKVLADKVDSIQKSVNIVDQDLEKDRQDISQLIIRIGSLEAQIDEMRKLISCIPQKTQDKVAEAIEPARQESADLKEVIMDKKVVAIDTQKAEQQVKHWWKFWNR